MCKFPILVDNFLGPIIQFCQENIGGKFVSILLVLVSGFGIIIMICEKYNLCRSSYTDNAIIFINAILHKDTKAAQDTTEKFKYVFDVLHSCSLFWLADGLEVHNPAPEDELK